MRLARSPSRICSLSGGPIFSPRVPLNFICPYDTEEEFHRRLLEVASPIGFSGPSYEDTLALAGSIRHDHETVFTHGDLMHWNILVHNGRISGIIDWETAGDYWEYATMLRTDLRGHWWGPFVRSLEGFHYERERESDGALLWITSSSFSGRPRSKSHHLCVPFILSITHLSCLRGNAVLGTSTTLILETHTPQCFVISALNVSPRGHVTASAPARIKAWPSLSSNLYHQCPFTLP